MHVQEKHDNVSVATCFVSIVDDTPGRGELDSVVSGELALFLT